MRVLNKSRKARKTTIIKTASEALAAFNIVGVTTSGQIKKSTSATELLATAYGMVEKAIGSGSAGEVTIDGEIYNPAWAWTIDGTNNNLLWIDASTSFLTETIPATAGRFSAPIAQITSATTIVLRINPFNVTEVL